ncbi:matrixin family metalloprotease [Paraflavitalea sp. CAU 1676]|uniref:matrixin family metalloprotease n=1 Tax=Paraflavitalea sp. CAU 1676 TaxID=3032598 RepID=UPI0023DB11DF|nr:matrixin family metalloprotease [Paraflavitalea sp. CAU 1676]MDF2189590.1 matrixin family metalloprotease [Paraflavitalea sp. CAU 1676]
MKNQLTPVSYLLLLLLSIPTLLPANELYPVSLSQRVANSTLIAEGKVIGQSTFADALGNIYTANRVIVYRTFKGSFAGEEIEVITHGGILGNRMQTYSSYLTLQTGQSGIFFCMPAAVKNATRKVDASTSYMVYSSMQGFIDYDTRQLRAADPFTRYNTIDDAAAAIRKLTLRETKLRTNPDLVAPQEVTTLGVTATPTITNLSPTTISAGTGAVLTITGTNFGATAGTVQFKNANNGGSGWVTAKVSDIVSWTDTEIQVTVPSSTGVNGPPAGSGPVQVTNTDPASVISSGSITIPYAYINFDHLGTTYKARHVNDNTAGGYTFQMETSFAASAGNASFRRAMDTWTCQTGMNWTVGTNTATNVVASDGVNVVRFDVGSELPAGVLGVCQSFFNGCGSPLNWFVSEMDITFNDATNWEYGPAAPTGGKVDFQSVAVHELGHGQQLTHIISPGAVMHYAIAANTQARVLSTGDVNGGNDVTARGFASNVCGYLAMTPGDVYTPAGLAGGSQVCVNSAVSVSGTTFSDATCNDIARVVPSGASPVNGNINVCVKYESAIQTYNSQPYCARHYDIEPASNAATATATVTLYYTQAEFDAYNAGNGAFPDLPTGSGDASGIANIRITQFHGMSGSGAPGTYSGSTETVDPDDVNIVWNATGARWEVSFAATGFSGFYMHTSLSSTLPLRLANFSGSIQADFNALQWTTASEQQTAYFDIERSADGLQFNTIGRVTASGNSNTSKEYRFTDKSLKSQPIYFYRLRMIDNNGHESYSQLIRLKRHNKDFTVRVLQNPYRQQLVVDITAPAVQTCELVLADMNGRVIARRSVILQNGNSLLDIPGAGHQAAGTYLLTLSTPTDRKVFKVLKQ